jgi:putative addiction module component (TIGR02574 family)
MGEAVAKLLPALLELSVDERLEAMDALAASLPAEEEAAFDATLQRRIGELDSGKVQGVPAEEVLERLRKKYAQ